MSNVFPSKKLDTPWPYVTDYTYDIECYPNFFSLAATHVQSGTDYFFEVSEWQDDLNALNDWLYWLRMNQARMIGFNNIGYDYWLLHQVFHAIPNMHGMTGLQKAELIYGHSSRYFDMDDDERHNSTVWPSDRIIEQIDLYKINHFDNSAKSTSLKVLEINMRSENVQELPIPPGTRLTFEQRGVLIPYNKKDTRETTEFLLYNLDRIKLREQMSEKFGADFMNDNDTKLGERYFELELKKHGVNIRGRTPRPEIRVADIIFPYIRFNNPEFNRVLDFLRSQVITKTKGVKYPCADVDIPWQFGQGGMHGSMDSTIVREDEECEIIDADVTSFYPCTAIANGLYPLHLGEVFCKLYQNVFEMRKTYSKGTMENMAFKLALNGSYGKSNSPYSCFFDPQFTMAITINGQLMLCMLGEWLMSIPGLSMIQANTDGVTFKVPRKFRASVENICKQWEQVTGLQLEYAYYKAMYIRDVNNYIAETTKGKLKNKGAYVHEGIEWHKDHSAVIIARAAENFLVRGVPVIDTITQCTNPFDFMIKAKVPRNSKLFWDAVGARVRLQNTTRYYASMEGGHLVKVMPPTNTMIEHWLTGTHYIRERDGDYKVVKPGGKRPAKTYTEVTRTSDTPQDREISINKDWRVTDCADAKNFRWDNLNYNYYISEANKLIDPLL